MVHGFIPTACRQVKVTFIPNPGKLDYTKAKAYRLISLSSFLLKTMEKLVDRNIRDGVLTIHPLHRNQHTQQKGKSTAVVRLMVTYPATIWWPRVRLKRSQAQLKLQRTVCLGITGAMRTAPTAALEVLLGLPPPTPAGGSGGLGRKLLIRL
jgi:hypothetical protein